MAFPGQRVDRIRAETTIGIALLKELLRERLEGGDRSPWLSAEQAVGVFRSEPRLATQKRDLIARERLSLLELHSAQDRAPHQAPAAAC